MSAWFDLQYGAEDEDGVIGGSNPAQAQLVMSNDTIKTLQTLLNVGEVANQVFTGAVFDANYNSKTVSGNVWGPRTEHFQCPSLDWLVSYLDSDLDLKDQKIRDFEPLASVPFVESLNLSGNQYKYGMSTIGRLQYLTKLNMTDAKVTTLKGLNNGSLETLLLNDNFILADQLQYLQGLGLIELELTNNKIRNLDELQNLPYLERLVIKGNKILAKDIASFINDMDTKLGSTPYVIYNGSQCTRALSMIENNAEFLLCD